MSCLEVKFQFKTLFKNFKSCSVVNADGALLYSKDKGHHILTTSRLVTFQIIKKYLKPQPQDLFVVNDPENGGFQLSKLIFLTSLTPNLFLIWDEDFSAIDFKIPPTPLFDKGVKNEFVWKALINGSPFAEDLESFILYQKYKVDQLDNLKPLIDNISQAKTQNAWLKSTQEVFDILFNNKAQGSSEAHHKLGINQAVKIKFIAEEKQNLKLLTLDFTNTNLATDYHAASHVVESALISRLNQYYEFGDYFTQSIFDKIKVILPPRSIVSKPHPTGAHNIELQSIVGQMFDFILTQLNSHVRKPHNLFAYQQSLQFYIRGSDCDSFNCIDKTGYSLKGIEELIDKKQIEVKKLQKTEQSSNISFTVTTKEALKLQIHNRQCEAASITIKVNDELKNSGSIQLKAKDQVEINWS